MWVTPNKKAEDYLQGFVQRGVVVSPGRLFAASNSDEAGFRLSFSAVKEERIAEGIGIIAAVLGEEAGEE